MAQLVHANDTKNYILCSFFSKKHFKDRFVCKIKCSDHKVKLMNDLIFNLLNNKSFACGTSIIRIPFFFSFDFS